MKKIIKKVIKYLIIIIVIGFLTYSNLKSNSVYYARNMKKGEVQYPEAIMLIENMEWMILPEIEDVRYSTKGANAIISKSEPIKLFGEYWIGEVRYLYSKDDDVFGSYTFNKNISDIKSYDIKETALNNIELKEEIEEFLEPVIEEFIKENQPGINLQWLFNIIYEKDFI